MHQRFLEIVQASPDDRRALYASAAAHLGTRAENVEKDLYVCWILDFLFNRRSDHGVRLYFKGGTSLSKAYGLIQRFSEDIDIGIYKQDLGVPLEAEIEALPSLNQRNKALTDQIDAQAKRYIAGPLKAEIDAELAATGKAVGDAYHFATRFGYDAYRKTDALDVLIVSYKSVFDTSGGYVEPSVRIEGGARPDPVPAEVRDIVPYVATELDDPDTLTIKNVMTVQPERTFWEKVLILHAMTESTDIRDSLADPAKPVHDLNRYSRHYYDVHQIWTDERYGTAAASLVDLAEAARRHKELMFRAPDHRYDRAIPGSYRLVPTPDMLIRLSADYTKMSAMIFGGAPSFGRVMTSISELEKFVNSPK